MDLFSRLGFGNFLFSIHVMIRRFGVVRILLTVAGVGIVISGLIGSTLLVQQSQETRKYASAGWCKVEDNGVTAGFVPCDTPGETLQGTYEQVMNIRDNAPAVTSVTTEQLQVVQQQVGNANTVVNEEGKREITGGTHGGQETVADCSGNSCNTGNEGNGAAVTGGGTPSGSAPSGTTTTPSTGTSTVGNGTTADNACTAQESCGGPNQGYCTCGADGKPDPKGKPTCQGGYEVLGGDCVPIGTKESVSGKPGDSGTHCQSDGECASGLVCSNRVCSEKPKETNPPVAAERYGITDNICHLPGANCVGDEAWRNGFAAARGDVKALGKLKEINPTVFSEVIVDGGVVKVGKQQASLQQPSQKGTQVSDEAQKRRQAETQRCSKTLHLCPMLDPLTLQVVGWVPADEAVFGTFAEAGLARQNLSIGNLFEEIEIGTEKYKAYNFNWQNLSAEQLAKMSGMTDPKEIERIAQAAEKNKVTTDTSGRIVIDSKYDIKKFEEDNKKFWEDQQKIQTRIVDSISKKDDPKIFQKFLDGCHALDDPAGPCNEKELWDFVKQNTHAELLLPETQKQIQGFVEESAGKYRAFLEAKHQAEIDAKQRQEQFMQAVNEYISDGTSAKLLALCKLMQDEKNDCQTASDALSLLAPENSQDILFNRQLTLAQKTYLESQDGTAIKNLCVQKYGSTERDCSDPVTALKKLNPIGAEKIIPVVTQIVADKTAREKIIPAAQQYIASGGRDVLALYQACLALSGEDKHACDSTSDILQRYLGVEAKNEILEQALDVKKQYETVSDYTKLLSNYDALCPTYKTDGKICENTKGTTVAEDVVRLQKQASTSIAPDNFSALQAVLDAYQSSRLNNADLLAICQDLRKQDGSISCSGSSTDVIKTITTLAIPGIEQNPSNLEKFSGELWLANKMQNLTLLEKTALALSPTIPDLYARGPLGKYFSKQYDAIYSDGSFDAKDWLTIGDTALDPLGARHNIVERAHSVFDDQANAVKNGSTSFGSAALTVTGRGINELTFGAFSKYVAENVELNSAYGNQNFTLGSQAYKDRVFNTENILSATKLGGVIAAEISGVGAVFAAPAAVPIALGAMNLSLSTSQAATACDMREQYYSGDSCKLMTANAVVAAVSLGATTYLGEAQIAYQAASKALAAVDVGADTAQALTVVNTAKTQFGAASAVNVFSTLTEGGINIGFAASSCSQGDIVGCGMSLASSALTLGRFGLQAGETATLLRGSIESAQDVTNRQLANQWLGKGGNALAITQASITCGAVMIGQGGQEGLAQCGQALASLKAVGLEGGVSKTGNGADVEAELAAANNASSKLANSTDGLQGKILISEAEMEAFIAQNEKNYPEITIRKLITYADDAIAQARGDLAELTLMKVDKGSQKTSKVQLDTVAETVKTTTESVERNIANLRSAYEVAKLAGDTVSMQKIHDQLTSLSSIAKELRSTAAELAANTTAPVTAKAVQDELGRLSTLAGTATRLANSIESTPVAQTAVPSELTQTTTQRNADGTVPPEPVKPLSLQEAEQIAQARLDQSEQEYKQAQQRYDDLRERIRNTEMIDVLGKKANELNVTIPQHAETTAENTAKLPQEFVSQHQDQITKLKALAAQVNELEQYMQSGQITKEQFDKHPAVSEYRQAISDVNAALSKEKQAVLAQRKTIEKSLGSISNVEEVRSALQSAEAVLEKTRSALASREMDFDYAHQQRVDQEKLAARTAASSDVTEEPDYSGLSLVEVRQRLGEVEQRIGEYVRAIELNDATVEDGGETALLQRELALFEQERKGLLLQQEKLTPSAVIRVFTSAQKAIVDIGKALFGKKPVVEIFPKRTPAILTNPKDIHKALTQAKSIEDIIGVLQRVESITGSDGTIYSRDQLIGYVRAVGEGIVSDNMVTRAGGLRDALDRVLHPPTFVEKGMNVLLSVQDPQLQESGSVINLTAKDGIATLAYPSSVDGEFVWTRVTLNGLSEQEVNKVMQRAWDAAENRRGLVTVSVELDGKRTQYNLLPPTDANAAHYFSVKTEDTRGWLARVLNPSGEVKPKPVVNKTQSSLLSKILSEGMETLLSVRNFQSNQFETVNLQSQEKTIFLRYEVVDNGGNRQTRSVVLNGLSADGAVQVINDAWDQAGRTTGKVRVDILSEDKKAQTFFPSAPVGGATGNDISFATKDNRSFFERLFGVQPRI